MSSNCQTAHETRNGYRVEKVILRNLHTAEIARRMDIHLPTSKWGQYGEDWNNPGFDWGSPRLMDGAVRSQTTDCVSNYDIGAWTGAKHISPRGACAGWACCQEARGSGVLVWKNTHRMVPGGSGAREKGCRQMVNMDENKSLQRGRTGTLASFAAIYTRACRVMSPIAKDSSRRIRRQSFPTIVFWYNTIINRLSIDLCVAHRSSFTPIPITETISYSHKMTSLRCRQLFAQCCTIIILAFFYWKMLIALTSPLIWSRPSSARMGAFVFRSMMLWLQRNVHLPTGLQVSSV